MSNLAIPVGTICAYNGFFWPNDTQTLEFSGRPVWDSAGRTIIYTNFTITLTCGSTARNLSPGSSREALSTTITSSRG